MQEFKQNKHFLLATLQAELAYISRTGGHVALGIINRSRETSAAVSCKHLQYSRGKELATPGSGPHMARQQLKSDKHKHIKIAIQNTDVFVFSRHSDIPLHLNILCLAMCR